MFSTWWTSTHSHCLPPPTQTRHRLSNGSYFRKHLALCGSALLGLLLVVFVDDSKSISGTVLQDHRMNVYNFEGLQLLVGKLIDLIPLFCIKELRVVGTIVLSDAIGVVRPLLDVQILSEVSGAEG